MLEKQFQDFEIGEVKLESILVLHCQVQFEIKLTYQFIRLKSNLFQLNLINCYFNNLETQK